MHEGSEQGGASKRVSGVSERANGRVSGPVLQSVFCVVLAHSAFLSRHPVPLSHPLSFLKVFLFHFSFQFFFHFAICDPMKSIFPLESFGGLGKLGRFPFCSVFITVFLAKMPKSQNAIYFSKALIWLYSFLNPDLRGGKFLNEH